MDLQQGIQIFELRIYAAEMGHRMPLRHEIHQLILAGFHAHGIDMPFPPFQMRLESLNGKQTGRTLTSAGKGRQAGSLRSLWPDEPIRLTSKTDSAEKLPQPVAENSQRGGVHKPAAFFFATKRTREKGKER